MQYFGGKAKISKYIVPFLESVRKEDQILQDLDARLLVSGLVDMQEVMVARKDMLILLKEVY